MKKKRLKIVRIVADDVEDDCSGYLISGYIVFCFHSV